MVAIDMQNLGELSVVLIGPNRALASQLKEAVSSAGAFSIEEELSKTPSRAEFEALLRRLRPAAALIDLSEDAKAGIELIKAAAAMTPPVQTIAFDAFQDARLIIESLRAGGAEFLTPPFETETMQAAAQRVRKLVDTHRPVKVQRGRAVAFVGVKPGQGVTTIASNVAAAAAQSGARTALLDLDMTAGTLSFCWRVTHSYNVTDAVQHAERMDETLWSALVTNRNGVDLLLGPDTPELKPLPGAMYSRLLEFVRSLYDLIVIDLSSAYSPEAKALLPDCDHIYLICNPELPSLHLTRKLIGHLESEGFSRDQISLAVNRMSRRHELGPQDMERVFNFPISHVFPEDDSAVHHAVTAGKPVPTSCELGRTLAQFGRKIAGENKKTAEDKKRATSGLKLSALLSQG